MKKLSNLFVLATTWSYFALGILALMERNPIAEPTLPSKWVAVAMFFCMFLINSPVLFKSEDLAYIICFGYGIAATLSFSGAIVWSPAGNQFLGPAMALWDLALAVAIGDAT